MMKKRNRIIQKVKSRYWTRTHKYGVRIPNSVKEAIALDKSNVNTLWWEAIFQDMKNVIIAFELYEGNVEDLPPRYQEVNCHIIFDANMGENLYRKYRMLSGGHKTTTPSSLTYYSVVSRDSVRIALKSAALNGLKVISCDIQNEYLTAKCREKIWTVAEPEFVPEQGKFMIF